MKRGARMVNEDIRSDEMSPEQALKTLDYGAKCFLGMTGEEWITRHDQGDIPDDAINGHLTDLLKMARQGS